MTNEEYLKSKGWTRDVGAMVFCWRNPKSRNLCTESQALAIQQKRDRDAQQKDSS